MKKALPVLIILAVLSACAGWAEDFEWDGSDADVTHRLPVFNEDGEIIVPDYLYSRPMSFRTTCGGCHDYDTVSGGRHFNASEPEAEPGRAGEPWVWVDNATGTWLPLSYRKWSGCFHPDEVGITPWRFTQLFGRHHPGDDMADPEEVIENPTPDSRWTVSGGVEANCLACHNGSRQQDMSEYAKQMERENFRWAATAASGMGDVKGMASRLEESWAPLDGQNPDDQDWAVPPYVRYDPNQFDPRMRFVFDVRHEMPDRNCLQCHSATMQGQERWHKTEDVHSASGMSCVSCHRNGLDHEILRGYASEYKERGDKRAAQFTCQGCHLGWTEEEGVEVPSGHYGAPRPEHKGLPKVHFERLTCTACHSGGIMGEDKVPEAMRLSRMHRLGIHGQAQWFRDNPAVMEPVFAEDESGRIGVFRLMWPAFWGVEKGEKVEPLLPDFLKEKLAALWTPEEDTALLLLTLSGAANAPGRAVLVSEGKVYGAGDDGKLEPLEETSVSSHTLAWLSREEGLLPLWGELSLDEQGYFPYATEGRILDLLKALYWQEDGQKKPVFVFDEKVFQSTLAGMLEPVEGAKGTSHLSGLAWLKGQETVSVLSDFTVETALALEQSGKNLSPGQVKRGLAMLAKELPGRKVAYVAQGGIFRLDGNGEIVFEEHSAGEAVRWPLAHQVRPAEQALGARSCQECHSGDSVFLAGRVEAVGPLDWEKSPVLAMGDLTGVDTLPNALLNLSWYMRPYFKTFAVGASILAFFLALLAFQEFARRFLMRQGGEKNE